MSTKGIDGSGGRIRTYDQRINSPLRYRCATPEDTDPGLSEPVSMLHELALRNTADGPGGYNAPARCASRSTAKNAAEPKSGPRPLCADPSIAIEPA